jgi:hypothetical protein
MADEQIEEAKHWVVALVAKLGVPSAILMLTFLALYRATIWTGSNVITPIVQRQVQVLTGMEQLLQSAERASRESNETIKHNSQKLDRILEKLNGSRIENP